MILMDLKLPLRLNMDYEEKFRESFKIKKESSMEEKVSFYWFKLKVRQKVKNMLR